jgi:hypothetical protein
MLFGELSIPENPPSYSCWQNAVLASSGWLFSLVERNLLRGAVDMAEKVNAVLTIADTILAQAFILVHQPQNGEARFGQ